MRALTYSLLFFVLVATVGLGWLFDRLYDQYQVTEQSQNNDAVNVLEQMGAELAIVLNILDNRDEFILNWQKKADSSTSALSDASKLNYNLELQAVSEAPLPTALLKGIQQGKSLLLETNSSLAFYYYLPASDELMILKSPMLASTHDKKPLNYIFTLLFYLVLLFLFLLWIYPLLRQLHQLRKSAIAFAQGKLHQRIKHSRLPYIKDIEVEFNHMAQRIEDLISDVKLLSSAVSHDLRTPLARIRFGVDTLQEEEDPVLRRHFEKKIRKNVDEMTALVETLLTYSRLDQSMLELKTDDVNFTQLIDHSIKLNETASTEITFKHSQHDIFIHAADQRYIAILVNNLLLNAMHYGNGLVNVGLQAGREVIQLSIEDNGCGVKKEQQDKIFLPFVRGNHEQTNDYKGHGIGLAIVKRIVDWHRGTISVTSSRALSGARFTIELPKN